MNTKFAIKEETVNSIIQRLTIAGYEGVMASEIRGFQPSLSAGNLIAEVTRLGYRVKCIDFGLDMTYVLQGKYENTEEEEK